MDKIKDAIKKNVKWSANTPPVAGGQSCGTPRSKQVLISEELDVKIEIGHYRSSLKNRKVAYTLFELLIDEFIK